MTTGEDDARLPWDRGSIVGYSGGYFFIGTQLSFDIPLPVILERGIQIDRADDYRIRDIQAFLPSSQPFFQSRRALYEQEFLPDPADPGRQNLVPLDKSAWRYFILSFAGTPAVAETFQRSVNLADHSFDCYPWIIHTSEPFGKGEHAGSTTFGASMPHELTLMWHTVNPIIVDAPVVQQWIELFGLLSDFDTKKYPGITRAIALFHDLKVIPPENGFRILGLFMIIEMLLTHKPGDKEVGDSLSHQISTKVPLLSRRFPSPLDYSGFGNTAEIKVWKNLYGLRSSVAHGDNPDYSFFKGREATEKFLLKATKYLLAHALKEPELYESLKPV